jgi:hypothetical protein
LKWVCAAARSVKPALDHLAINSFGVIFPDYTKKQNRASTLVAWRGTQAHYGHL